MPPDMLAHAGTVERKQSEARGRAARHQTKMSRSPATSISIAMAQTCGELAPTVHPIFAADRLPSRPTARPPATYMCTMGWPGWRVRFASCCFSFDKLACVWKAAVSPGRAALDLGRWQWALPRGVTLKPQAKALDSTVRTALSPPLHLHIHSAPQPVVYSPLPSVSAPLEESTPEP
jgi:hypothetical protein